MKEIAEIYGQMLETFEEKTGFAMDDTADLDLVAGNSLADDNILGQTEKVKLVSSKVSGVSSQFNYTVPKYSVSILRLKKKK